MTPAEHDDDVRETLRRIRRELAVLDGPSRERKLRAGLAKPKNAAEWVIFGADWHDPEPGADAADATGSATERQRHPSRRRSRRQPDDD
jgi:hypothetical protein